jgi:polyphosphate kinase 2 (PPK2 family)
LDTQASLTHAIFFRIPYYCRRFLLDPPLVVLVKNALAVQEHLQSRRIAQRTQHPFENYSVKTFDHTLDFSTESVK